MGNEQIEIDGCHRSESFNVAVIFNPKVSHIVDSALHLTKYLLDNDIFRPRSTRLYLQMSLRATDSIKRFLQDSTDTTQIVLKDNSEFRHVAEEIDLIITLGGDGTVLYASSLFPESIPPSISFNLGTLGFLANFDFKDCEQILQRYIDKQFSILNRTRLTCEVHRQDSPNSCEGLSFTALNDIVIARGPSATLVILDIIIDSVYITTLRADGICISTPTGSTAYSLSAGGSLCHPKVKATLITPICPHTLSFRPLQVPFDSEITITVSEESRFPLCLTCDGQNKLVLASGDYISIKNADHDFKTLSINSNGSTTTEWIECIRSKFLWSQK